MRRVDHPRKRQMTLGRTRGPRSSRLTKPRTQRQENCRTSNSESAAKPPPSIFLRSRPREARQEAYATVHLTGFGSKAPSGRLTDGRRTIMTIGNFQHATDGRITGDIDACSLAASGLPLCPTARAPITRAERNRLRSRCGGETAGKTSKACGRLRQDQSCRTFPDTLPTARRRRAPDVKPTRSSRRFVNRSGTRKSRTHCWRW
jgi:hypothetical protein